MFYKLNENDVWTHCAICDRLWPRGKMRKAAYGKVKSHWVCAEDCYDTSEIEQLKELPDNELNPPDDFPAEAQYDPNDL